MTATTTMARVRLTCEGLEAPIEVSSIESAEAISRPFAFDLVIPPTASAELDALVGRAATLEISGSLTLSRSGVVAEVERSSGGEGRLRLRPRLSQLELSRRSRFFQRMTVPEILSQGLDELDVELELDGRYDVRATVTQYEETDLDFLSRLMEHEGICYYFRHDAEAGPRLVVTDDTLSRGGSEPVLRLGDGPGEVLDLTSRRRQLPRRLILTDSSAHDPQLPLEGEATVDPEGHGVVSESSAGFDTPAEGQRLAGIRAEELRCRQQIFHGRGQWLALTPGESVRIDGVTLLITEARHSLDLVRGESVLSFEGVPATRRFRPTRSTPRPRVTGALPARTAGTSGRAEMDDQGRYRVELPFDVEGGEPSSFLPLAQPWSGAGQGMHFPLDAGASVLWSCINGDPDRPVITGAVPTALAPSPVTRQNQSRSVIRARGGAQIEFGTSGGGPETLERMAPIGPTDLRPAIAQRQLWDPPEGGTAMAGTVESTESDANKFFKIKVPNYNTDGGDCYLRMGKFDNSEAPEQEFANMSSDGSSGGDRTFDLSDGTFDYTDGNRAEITALNRNVIIGGKSRFAIGAGGMGVWDAGTCFYNHTRKVGETFFSLGPAVWRTTTVDNGASDTYTYGDSESFSAGFSFSGRVGLDAGVFIGGKIDMAIAASLSLSASISTSFTAGISWEESKGGSVYNTSNAESSAQISNKMNVKPLSIGMGGTALPWFTSIAGLLTAGIATGVTFGMSQDDAVENAVPLGLGTGAAAGLLTAFTLATATKYATHKASPPVTEISLSPTDITIGMAAGPPLLPGIKISGSGILISHNPASFIRVTAAGVTINSPKLSVTAPGKIDMTAGADISLAAAAKITGQAMGSLTMESTATTTVKGSLMTIDAGSGTRKGVWADG